MRNLSFRSAIACALLLVLGCDGSTAPFEQPKLAAKEGQVFRFLVEHNIGGFKDEFVSEARLLSTIAEIGGRDSLLAYQWFPDDAIEFWDIRSGELWHFRSTEDVTGDAQSGVWVQYPTEGAAPVTTEVYDVTIVNSTGSGLRFRRVLEAEAGKRESVRFQGNTLDIQRITAREVETSWSDGVAMDTSVLTHSYAFIKGLGMLESSRSTAEDGSWRRTTLISVKEE